MRILTGSLLVVMLLVVGPAMAGTPAPETTRFFENHVRPLLADHCFKCHGGKQQRGGLRLDAHDGVLQGGESGPAVIPGKPEESLLLQAVKFDGLEMPPTGKLSEQQIAVLKQWIEMGAPWPHHGGTSTNKPNKEDAAHSGARKPGNITAEDRAFWSFQPPREPPLPQVDDPNWNNHPIDQLLARQQESVDLRHAAEADRRTLIRRATFTLHGLPPTPEAVATFIADPSPHAYEVLIDRLLASPRYGEHWARHWLDLVRYAESDGYRQDAYRHHAWHYRDYVARAFNEDMPYNQFVTEQLAGDEIAPHDPNVLVATGYLRHWIYEYNQRDARTQWNTILNDITDVTGDVFLGMGISCARCHDHKFDPILQKDYFRLQAFFAPMLPRDDLPLANAKKQADYLTALAGWETASAEPRARLERLEAPYRAAAARGAIDKFPKDIQDIMTKPAAARDPLEVQIAELVDRQIQYEFEYDQLGKQIKGDARKEWEKLRQQLSAFDKIKPAPLPVAFAVSDVGMSAPVVTIPGDRKTRPIEPGFLSVLDPNDAEITPVTAYQSTGRRLALAQWLTRPDHPLTTRVIVNRVWQYHFGRGLVATASDFGTLGERPTHPELLDYLATRFVREGWSLKRLHKLLLTSAAYRQSSLHTGKTAQRDPDNRWFARRVVRRLTAEAARDAMLSVSGELDVTVGGPSVDTNKPRRALYVKVIRNARDPFLAAFDAADGFNSCACRDVTTTPTQALLLINGPWTVARAKAFATRLTRAENTPVARLRRAYQLAFARAPSQQELTDALAFLHRPGVSSDEALVDFCHVLLNSNEFLYVD